MKTTFGRLILYVHDVEALKGFYSENFGFEVIEEIASEWVVLKSGSMELALHRIGEAYRTDAQRTTSNAKLVFNLAGGNLEAFRTKLIEQGVVMREPKTFTGFDYLLCDGEDPEGNVFQLMQKV